MSIYTVLAAFAAIVTLKLLYDKLLLPEPELEEGSVTGRKTTKLTRLDVTEDPNSANPHYMVGGTQEGQPLGSGAVSGLSRYPVKEALKPPAGIYYIQHVDSLRSLVGGNRVSLAPGFSEASKWDVSEDGCIKSVGMEGKQLMYVDSRKELVRPLDAAQEISSCLDCKVVVSESDENVKWDIGRVQGETEPGVYYISLVKLFLGAGRADGVRMVRKPERWLFIPVGSRGYVQY